MIGMKGKWSVLIIGLLSGVLGVVLVSGQHPFSQKQTAQPSEAKEPTLLNKPLPSGVQTYLVSKTEQTPEPGRFPLAEMQPLQIKHHDPLFSRASIPIKPIIPLIQGVPETSLLLDVVDLKDLIVDFEKIVDVEYGAQFDPKTAVKLISPRSVTIHFGVQFKNLASKVDQIKFVEVKGPMTDNESEIKYYDPVFNSDTTGTQLPLQVDLSKLPPGKHYFALLVGKNVGMPAQLKFKASRSVEIYIPETEGPPAIVETRNGQFAEFKDVKGKPTISLYDKLLGVKYSIPPGSEGKDVLFFLISNVADHKVKPLIEPVSFAGKPVAEQKGSEVVWRVDLKFGELRKFLSTGVLHKLVARLEKRDGHIYSSSEILLKFLPDAEGELVRLGVPQFTTVKKIVGVTETEVPADGSGDYLINKPKLRLSLRAKKHAEGQLLLYSNLYTRPEVIELANLPQEANNEVSFVFDKLPKQPNQNPRPYTFWAQYAIGEETGKKTEEIRVILQTHSPRVVDVNPPDFGSVAGTQKLTIHFNPENPIAISQANKDTFKSKFKLRPSGNTGIFTGEAGVNDATLDTPETVELDQKNNAIILGFSNLKLDLYRLEVSEDIQDIFGNFLEGTEGTQRTPYLKEMEGSGIGPLAAKKEPSTLLRGLTGFTGDFVKYHEFTKFRTSPPGFNPGDHVETRVVRLYYFRDAHRVAQIVNRHSKSHNYQAVAIKQRMADQARDRAELLTTERQAAERAAVKAAERSREILKDLQGAQQQLAANVGLLSQPPRPLSDPEIKILEEKQRDLQELVVAKTQALQTASAAEVKANEHALHLTANEDLTKKEAFRLSVAAAHTDPDTYAEGRPDSYDPIEQVTVSVIGEGVIQLRGPMHGINLIREAIHQIDSPVGQVRIAVHTLQINGEKAVRMEKVAGQIQEFIDHSRFMTVQSAQMLRKAIVKVASRVALQYEGLEPPGSQKGRDLKYLYGFFGKDFIDELITIDSEFLKTGNKLLSLHSMDTTSLASALFILALAKNDTRREILNEFQFMLQNDLAQAEMNFFEAGGCRTACGENLFGKCRNKGPCLLAPSAKFQSLIGFFDAELVGTDTMTPVQREFVKLAQILKTQLVTELQLKQRVIERSLIEERVGSYLKELKKAKDIEENALVKVKEVQESISQIRPKFLPAFGGFLQEVRKVKQSTTDMEDIFNGIIEGIIQQLKKEPDFTKFTDDLNRIQYETNLVKKITLLEQLITKLLPTTDIAIRDIAVDPIIVREFGTLTTKGKFTFSKEAVRAVVSGLNATRNVLDRFFFFNENRQLFGATTLLIEVLQKKGETAEISDVTSIILNFRSLSEQVLHQAAIVENQVSTLVNSLGKLDVHVDAVVQKWEIIKQAVLFQVKDRDLLDKANEVFRLPDILFAQLLERNLDLEFAKKAAADARRPLDHRKFLDMLIEEVHDKYVDLLEGTRAHTANIDNFVKQLATALEDDFNRQFYYPAFSGARKTATSSYWDVQFGQIETTNILANNRTFAKVSPEATMEFDLPRRSIFVTEAMGSAKGLIDTYGALLEDPTFLSLTKLNAGQPATARFNGQAGSQVPIVNAVPGLPRSPDQGVMSQFAPERQNFGTPLDSLIPDPAIYKFETGTGFEIRPVIQPDGQAVVFHFNYEYTTNIREPVRPDEKHLGRIKRHFIDTDVQLGNYELREVSRYTVALKAARTAKGVPLLEDIPGLGILFRPLPSAESSLQQNLILSQATIFPTLFDLMGLRWAPSVADVDALGIINDDFIVRMRHKYLSNKVYDFSSSRVDDALRVLPAERRPDLWRGQEDIPFVHPNGYSGPGSDLKDSHLQEGYSPEPFYPPTKWAPATSEEGRQYPPNYKKNPVPGAGMMPLPSSLAIPQGTLPGPGAGGYQPGMLPPTGALSPNGKTVITPGQPAMPSGYPGQMKGYSPNSALSPHPVNPYPQQPFGGPKVGGQLPPVVPNFQAPQPTPLPPPPTPLPPKGTTQLPDLEPPLLLPDEEESFLHPPGPVSETLMKRLIP